MAKFCDVIGYGTTVEVERGVWEDVIIERTYYGDVLKDSLDSRVADEILPGIKLGNYFSIVGDPFAYENYSDMRYIRWMGQYWSPSSIEVVRPRLLIRIGNKYNGPTA